MATTIEYKCPCCGGNVEFSSELQQMQCPFCETVFTLDQLKAKDEALAGAGEPAPAPDTFGEDADAAMGVYTCRSCGGELIADANTAATQCPYCSNPIILSKRLAGELMPEQVLPFKLNKENAKAQLKKFMSGKKLLPKSFSEENKLDEIKGVYVPFWLFDVEMDADIRYNAQKKRTWTEGDYKYEETKYYQADRVGSLLFDNIPADGSKKMADDVMESLEPYDLREAKPFQTAYLSGYFADKYDVSAEECVSRANERAKESTVSVFRNTVNGYDRVETAAADLRPKNAKPKYALLPVWLLNTVYNGQKYQFAMNGQTGKFVGQMPMDKGAYWKWKLIYSAIAAAVIFGMEFVVSMFADFQPVSFFGVLAALALGFLLSFIPMASLKKEIDNVSFASEASDYMRRDSLYLSVNTDRFIREETNKTRIQRQAPAQQQRNGPPNRR